MRWADLPLVKIAAASAGKRLAANFSNRRTRVLLLLLGATTAIASLTMLDALDTALQRRIAECQQQLARVEQLANADWRQRRDETEPLRVKAESRLWEAETDGLAQANFQSWITEQAGAAGVGPIEVHTAINANTNNPMKLRQLSAQVSGRFEPEGFFRLLQAIAGNDRLVIVERLDVQMLPVAHFEMMLQTYLRPAHAA
jgi:hypothetical protein